MAGEQIQAPVGTYLGQRRLIHCGRTCTKYGHGVGYRRVGMPQEAGALAEVRGAIIFSKKQRRRHLTLV
jgi:hypothetical protein